MPRRQALTQDGEWLPDGNDAEDIQVLERDFVVLMTQSSSEAEAEVIHVQHRLTGAEDRQACHVPHHMERTSTKSTHATFRTYKDLATERASIQTALDSGYVNLITTALAFEQNHSPSFGWSDIDDRAGHMFVILLAVDNRILKHHIQGDFVQHYKQSGTFRKLCDDLRRSVDEHQQPVIYRCTIADSMGLGHNNKELSLCLHYMSGYAENALDIRTRRAIAQQATTEGIVDVAAFERRVKCSSDTIRAFVENAKRRGTAHDSPMTYVGVTTNPSNRRASHEKGSHGLMALFLAISKYLFSAKFDLHWHPLFACFEPGQMASGEILFERLGCGLVATGGGFNCEPAGKAITARTGPTDQDWSLWSLKAMKDAKFVAELAAVTEGSQEWNARKKVLRQQARRAGLAAYLAMFLETR